MVLFLVFSKMAAQVKRPQCMIFSIYNRIFYNVGAHLEIPHASYASNFKVRENIASSRRSVSQGAVQKTAREKIKKKRGERKRDTAPWLTERLEEARENIAPVPSFVHNSRKNEKNQKRLQCYGNSLPKFELKRLKICCTRTWQVRQEMGSWCVQFLENIVSRKRAKQFLACRPGVFFFCVLRGEREAWVACEGEQRSHASRSRSCIALGPLIRLLCRLSFEQSETFSRLNELKTTRRESYYLLFTNKRLNSLHNNNVQMLTRQDVKYCSAFARELVL